MYDGIKINLEFVSANPTGPIHMGGVRWAAVGDSLARVLAGRGRGCHARVLLQRPRLADRPLRSQPCSPPTSASPPRRTATAERTSPTSPARSSSATTATSRALPRDEQQEVFRAIGVELHVHRDQGEAARLRRRLRRVLPRGLACTSPAPSSAPSSACASRATSSKKTAPSGCAPPTFGDDRDRVIIRCNGEPAYISGDLGYYLDKRERGFDQNLIMLGADHHGYVGRLMAIAEALRRRPRASTCRSSSARWSTCCETASPCACRKRAGTIVTLDDLVDAVGVDAGRYALVRSSSDSQLDIDLDLLSKRTNENPVFYVQYAHARTASVARNAADVRRRPLAPSPPSCSPTRRSRPCSARCRSSRASSPRPPNCASRTASPATSKRSPGYYHRWYDNCRVIPLGDEPVTDLHRTRLWLNDATGQVIRNGLGLLGVSAPERM